MASEVSISVDGEEATPLSERFEQLRHSLHGRWGTSAEANLLRAMQQLHARLVTRSAQTHRRVEELSQRATAAQVSLANTFNSLKLLSQQQFMQHRIATEDLQLRERAAAGSGSEEAEVESSDDTASPNQALGAALLTHATREAAVRRRMYAYVEMCRESLEDEGVRVPLSPGDAAELAVDSPYTHRRLCALIGTPAFLYDADIGCGRGVNGLSVAAKPRLSPQPQPARFLADGAPASVTGLPSASAKPLSLPGAATEAVVPSPHAATTSAAAPPAKSALAKKSAILSKKERQRALFSSSSSSASSSASPSAAPTPAAPPRSSLSKSSAATSARPPKSAPAKKGARYLFGSSSSSSSVSRSSINRSRAEAAEHAADSPTSSSLSSSDGSSPPPAAMLKASNLSPPPPPHALTTAPSPRAASASTHSSRVSSASLGAPTPPPPQTSSVEAAPANFAPPSAALPPPPPPPLPAAAAAAADLPPPPPPVVLFDTVPDMDAPAPPPLATAAQLSPPPSTATPSRTAAVAAGAVSSLPRRGGKVLSTSSDEDAA
ncbi:hypothetical protein LSCM4_04326 [Leishmania orientalis]|uniref:Uncharacterized protein n=1 Tax=Leishmania orientalis TaxID=2249476 RepID=A0A836GIK5_9TRYP|nr:hypothetical protein LSCM4_04326 [Leishmania orientalis]